MTTAGSSSRRPGRTASEEPISQWPQTSPGSTGSWYFNGQKVIGTAYESIGDVGLLAYHATGTGNESGAAYVFTQSGTTWSQLAELTSPTTGPAEELGYSVALSGSTVLAGAAYFDEESGTAYVFVGV